MVNTGKTITSNLSNMKFNRFILLAIIGLALNACNQSPAKKDADGTIKYYRGIQFSETPWDTEKGTHPLTSEEAKTINNYKFTYNEKAQLVSVEFNRNNVLQKLLIPMKVINNSNTFLMIRVSPQKTEVQGLLNIPSMKQGCGLQCVF